jgi:NADPH:quinone reductase-like Zn-dependent oxidoreductase
MVSEYKVIRYYQRGGPLEVVRVEAEVYAAPKSGDAVVKMLAAPINPSDINLLEGT